jgi:hypothetical protein
VDKTILEDPRPLFAYYAKEANIYTGKASIASEFPLNLASRIPNMKKKSQMQEMEVEKQIKEVESDNDLMQNETTTKQEIAQVKEMEVEKQIKEVESDNDLMQNETTTKQEIAQVKEMEVINKKTLTDRSKIWTF